MKKIAVISTSATILLSTLFLSTTSCAEVLCKCLQHNNWTQVTCDTSKPYPVCEAVCKDGKFTAHYKGQTFPRQGTNFPYTYAESVTVTPSSYPPFVYPKGRATAAKPLTEERTQSSAAYFIQNAPFVSCGTITAN